MAFVQQRENLPKIDSTLYDNYPIKMQVCDIFLAKIKSYLTFAKNNNNKDSNYYKN